MTAILLSSAPFPLRDSQRPLSALCVSTVNAALAALGALVLLSVHGLLLTADRTSLRTTLNSTSPSEGSFARRCAVQPGSTWTISRLIRTFFLRIADLWMRGTAQDTRHATHPLEYRHAFPAESPGVVPINDETRDLDQCEPARNAGRHHRGRPAR